MQPSDLENATGVSLLTLVPGFLGAALQLSYAKDLSRAQALVALALGTAVAIYGAPLVIHWMPEAWHSEPLERGFAFFMGLFAMPLVPIVQDVISTNLRKIKFPGTKE